MSNHDLKARWGFFSPLICADSKHLLGQLSALWQCRAGYTSRSVCWLSVSALKHTFFAPEAANYPGKRTPQDKRSQWELSERFIQSCFRWVVHVTGQECIQVSRSAAGHALHEPRHCLTGAHLGEPTGSHAPQFFSVTSRTWRLLQLSGLQAGGSSSSKEGENGCE